MNGKLRYAGKVGTGFDEAALKSFARMLDKLRADEPPFVNPPKGAEGRRALGEAGARRGNRVHRMDARRDAASSVVRGAAPRQAGEGRRAGEGSARRRRPAGSRPRESARPALEDRRRRDQQSGQAAVPGHRPHQARALRVLRGRRAADAAARHGPSADAGALSRRCAKASASTRSMRKTRCRRGSTASRCRTATARPTT